MAKVNIKIEGHSYQVEEGLTILEAASWREEKAWLAEKTGFPGKTKEAIEAAKEAFKESAEKYRSYGNQIYEALKAGGYYDRS